MSLTAGTRLRRQYWKYLEELERLWAERQSAAEEDEDEETEEEGENGD